MSNLSSAFGEGSISSNQQFFASASQNPSQGKKKRNLPGNPDPDAEVIAMSPKSLLATNRFVCEICNKGFQRDQNLQLHLRGHNVPWKLKQRSSKEVVRKKVYICPEVTCVHHDPARALGDLTGIKKHFCRKHWEKKWKCERCNKKYAVRSDWKAHSKTCGTKEYRCGCGTLFSRRDSFITHRAFCDALSDECARSNTLNPLTLHHHHYPFVFPQSSAYHDPHQATLQAHFPNTCVNASSHGFQEFKREEEQLQPVQHLSSTIPPWVVQQVISSQPMTSLPLMDLPSSIFHARLEHDIREESSSVVLPSPLSFHSTASPHMSATALLQRAARMGATMSSSRDLHSAQADAGHFASSGLSSNPGFGRGLPSAEGNVGEFAYSTGGAAAGTPPSAPPLVNDTVMTSLAFSAGCDRSFEDAYGGILGLKRENNNGVTVVARRKEEVSAGSYIAGGGGNDGMTRDFLGLRAFYHKDILNMAAGMDQCMSSTYDQTQMKKPWNG